MKPRTLHVISPFLSVLILNGCIALAVPIPAHEKPWYEERIPGLQIGITHQNDVISQFGDPDVNYFQNSEFLYTTLANTWKVPWLVGGLSGGDVGIATFQKRHILLMSFDEAGVLSSFEIDEEAMLLTRLFSDSIKVGWF